MALDALVRVLYRDEGAATGLTKINQELRRVDQFGPGARRGMRLVETGMRSLAFEAVGAQGAVGQLAQGLLLFGGGSAAVLGVAAGIGAVIGVYKLATRETRNLEKANQDLAKAFQETAATGAVAAAGLRVFAAEEAVAVAQAAVGRARGGAEPLGPGQRLPGVSGVMQDVTDRLRRSVFREDIGAKIIMAETNLTTATNTLTAAENNRAEALRKAREAGAPTSAALRAEARAFLETMGLSGRAMIGPTPTGQLVGRGGPIPQFGQGFRLDQAGHVAAIEADVARVRAFGLDILKQLVPTEAEFQEQLTLLNRAVAAGVIPAERRAEAEAKLREAMGKTARAAERSAVAMIGAFGALVGAIAGGGGPGGILGALGGVAAAAGFGVPGAVLGVAGGLVSILSSQHRDRERNEDRRHQQLLGVLQEGPQRVTVLQVGGTPEEANYAIRRQERLDRTPRLGG